MNLEQLKAFLESRKQNAGEEGTSAEEVQGMPDDIKKLVLQSLLSRAGQTNAQENPAIRRIAYDPTENDPNAVNEFNMADDMKKDDKFQALKKKFVTQGEVR